MPDGAEETRGAPDLTPAGFTRMLHEAGALPQGAVTSAAITQRLRTTVSHLCFAKLTYSRQAPELPESVLVKWPLEATAAAGLPGFLEALGDTLSRRDRQLLERVFGSSLSPWLRLVDRRALTVVHGDAHSLNFLFPRSGAGRPYLVDWQLWHLDVGARDLAYLIALHWSPALRRDLERPLLHWYHRQLVARSVSGYSFDDLWLDYRRCAVRNLTFPIVLWSRGQPVKSWRHRLECALASYRDLDGDEFL